MASKRQEIIETDLYEVWEAMQALGVIRARARNWATSPHVSRYDVESLNRELRLLERGLAAGRKHDQHLNGDVNHLWARFLGWCSAPYIKRDEPELVLAELDAAEAQLLRTQRYLSKRLKKA